MGRRTYTYDGSDWVGLTSTTADLSSYANMTTTPISGFRNAIINGGFNIHQRGGTISTTTATNTYSLDRWYGYTSSGAFSMQQSTDVQTGFGFTNSLLATCTTADATVDAGDFNSIAQRIEGYQAASLGFGDANTSITLSFWVKSSLIGTYCVSFRNNAANRSYVAEYTVNVANTWEKKTITLTTDIVGTWEKTNGIGIRLDFALAAGTNYRTAANTWAAGSFIATSNQVNWLSSNTSRTFQLSGVQLERGTIATPFEQRPIGTELALCQRYFTRLSGGPYAGLGTGISQSATRSLVIINYPMSMRINPSIATFSNLIITDRTSYDLGVTSIAVAHPGTNTAYLAIDHNSGAAAYRTALLTCVGSSSGYLDVNAEL